MPLPLLLILTQRTTTSATPTLAELLAQVPHISQPTKNAEQKVYGDLETLTIKEVRELQQLIVMTPFAGNESWYLIHQIDRASVPAQNALLKTLEEPPQHARIVLTATNLGKVLPTIQSRCDVQRVENSAPTVADSPTIEEARQLLDQIPSFSYGQIFQFSDQYKDREQAINLIENLMTILHQKLSQVPNQQHVQHAQALLKAKDLLEKNLQVRLVLEECCFAMRKPAT